MSDINRNIPLDEGDLIKLSSLIDQHNDIAKVDEFVANYDDLDEFVAEKDPNLDQLRAQLDLIKETWNWHDVLHTVLIFGASQWLGSQLGWSLTRRLVTAIAVNEATGYLTNPEKYVGYIKRGREIRKGAK